MENVSVVIPTYNRAALLRRTIETVIQGTTPEDEIIVVDDGSTDETSQVPTEFKRKVRYIPIPNGGAGAARNAGVGAATHDLIGFADSDDEWMPRRLDQQRPLMESRRDLVFSFTDFGQLFPDGHIEKNWLQAWHHDRRPWDEILGPGQPCSELAPLANGVADVTVHMGSMYLRLLHAGYVNVNTLLVRRSLAGDQLHFGLELPTWEDYECSARIARMGRCAYLDIDTALQRAHSGPRLTDADKIQVAKAHLEVISRVWAADGAFVRDHCREINAVKEQLHKILARRYLVREQFDQARLSAAKLEHLHLESALLWLPSPILSSALKLYRTTRKLLHAQS
jgi:glycosyltransferase involved in cell wall biosynthesis